MRADINPGIYWLGPRCPGWSWPYQAASQSESSSESSGTTSGRLGGPDPVGALWVGWSGLARNRDQDRWRIPVPERRQKMQHRYLFPDTG